MEFLKREDGKVDLEEMPKFLFGAGEKNPAP